MKRRDFISAASSMLVPVMLNGFGVRSVAKGSALVRSLQETAAMNSDRVLVIIYLGGGNDGLNTVIPVDQYSSYYNLRSNIAIPENSILKLSGQQEVGFHPVMTGMKNLFEEGKLAIINSVSYPNPDQSHYRSTDIWMTGTDASRFESTGWGGRYLNDRFSGYPTNYPNSGMEDPLAVQIGQISTPALLGSSQSVGITIQDPNSFYQLIGESSVDMNTDLPCCDAGDLLKFIREKQVLAVGYAAEIKAAADAGKNLGAYPDATAKNDLAEQLKIVARLIHGGLKSKIYFVELGGFDTHSTQVSNVVTEGVHAQLLKKLSDAISSFQNDLKLQGIEDKVLGMTFSDFGRRATSNASKGTDHGVAAPLFVFGKGIRRQMIGIRPDLTNGLLPANPAPGFNDRDIKMQIDFRRIYSDILTDWFGTPVEKSSQLLFRNFETTSLFSDTVKTLKSGVWHDPEVWSSGRVPSRLDKVHIRSGHLVQLANTAFAKDLKVESGAELQFLGKYDINIGG
ncbi:DUF1501 domain-containing protein [Dyadobacter sp. CY261]|uniref:DUF1501 domain-containing protein n=1 Tax=Dyadobacter sp. CY261 TaxID=2907203 RepID=UPI001F28CC5C|nr:DUF1501 domain-containing protein [Dyadobacter sp. CY261]MCF0075109.1 DUF1501 domain-containing protein [Dyadobacter sp. CY261]